LSKIFPCESQIKTKNDIDADTNTDADTESSHNIIHNKQIIEDLGLERIYYGMVSYIILLQYCYEHNTTLVEKLTKPNTSFLDSNRYLILTHNAINQINLLSTNKNGVKHNRLNRNIDSLFSVINYTNTPLGKRYLMSKLCNPITDIKLLNETYDMTEDLILNRSLLNDITLFLKEIPDLERYQRKLYLRIIKPNEFVTLFKSYLTIVKIYTKLYESNLSVKKMLFQASEFNQCLSLIFSKYKLEILSKYKIDNNKLILSESNLNENLLDNKLFFDKQDDKADSYWKDIKRYQEH
ncbi:unnamed protein product, partial [marine sediment metagenome]